MSARAPKLDGDEVAARVANLSREPFREVLGRLIEAEPSIEAVHEFAEKYPDRWAQSLAIMGRLSGFNEKLEVETNIAVNISRMSDAEVMVRLAEVQARLEDLGGENVIPLPPAKRDGNN